MTVTEMFIPNAYLLNQTYKKHRSDLSQRIANEKALISGDLVRLLRDPKKHKRGVVSAFFSREKFPILGNEGAEEELEKIMKLFRDSGYQVSLEKSDDGFSLDLDWTEAGIS
ncbi:hypothetical protein ACM26X_03780 [Kluyvera cryocrescens]|uniref:hypothetical protein n=1 Tax=Kluyvera cryocrescens TaxID=580 RepID=UPI0039F48BB9